MHNIHTSTLTCTPPSHIYMSMPTFMICRSFRDSQVSHYPSSLNILSSERKRWSQICCSLYYGRGACRTWYFRPFFTKNRLAKMFIHLVASFKYKKFFKDHNSIFQFALITHRAQTLPQVAKDSI